MDQQTSRHILVVEDDESYCRMVARMLKTEGYRVTMAEDFSAAIAVIDSPEPIDLLLTDVGMPAGTPHGLSIGKVAEFRRQGLRVLYMTGGHDLTKFTQFAAGAPVLRKPFTTNQLLAAVATALA